MKIRRILALALSLALGAALLAGCGGSRALSRVVAGLLEGQYANVAVETDPELERTLRRAAAEGGDIADILARLKNGLNLTGGALTLSGLGEGQQGERAVELRFEAGDDSDAAARKAFAAWNAAFGGLPGDGQYAASIAMVAGEGGYYIAVDVTVIRAGAQKEDSNDEPEKPEEPEEPYIQTDANSYTVNTTDGLIALFQDTERNQDGFAGKTITLKAGATFTVSHLADTFNGTLTSAETNKATIEITGENLTQGLFKTVGENGTVENLRINITANINATATDNFVTVGAVAGTNNGAITYCEVTIESGGRVSASGGQTNNYVGGVAGSNDGAITGCEVTIESGGRVSASDAFRAYAGGVAGDNNNSITGCEVTIESGGGISASGGQFGNNAGGVAGSADSLDIVEGKIKDNTVNDHSGLALKDIGSQ